MSTIRGRARRLETAGKGIRKNRYTAIAEDLRHQIVTGHLKPDQRMPSEQELAGRYGVTVLTLRQAQRILIEEGLIRKEHGRGTFVSEQARRHRRALLVCGLAHPTHGSSAAMASPYFLNAIAFCRQAAMARALALEVAWIENYPSAPLAALTPEPVSGYIFLACDPHHPLVQRAQAEGAHCVHLGKAREADRTIWFHMVEAARLAWEDLQEEIERRRLPVVVASVQGENAGVQELAQRVPGGIRHMAAPNTLTVWEYEQWCYRSIRHLCAGGTEPMAFVFLDDILARGGTRALLEAGLGDGRCPVAVVSGKQEMAPYGLPVTYVMHDTELESRWAVEMLLAQIEGDPAGTAPRQSPFVLEAAGEGRGRGTGQAGRIRVWPGSMTVKERQSDSPRVFTRFRSWVAI